MPWCPKCEFEYVAGVTRCPDCGTTLVCELPRQPADPLHADLPSAGAHRANAREEDFEQVLLCTAIGTIQTEMLRNALAAAGIPSRSAAVGDLYLGFPTPSLDTPIRVWVNRRDLARARMIYHDHEGRAR